MRNAASARLRRAKTACAALMLAAALFQAGSGRAADLPLRLADAVRAAFERRAEVDAALARVAAGEARPTIVSALEDPMISPAIDHKPFDMPGVDKSLAVEQRFPLAPVRRHRRESALADVVRLRAEARRSSLGVGLEAATAFLMLQERRRTAELLREQLRFARDVVSAANARYAGGTAPQSDVLRAEVEVARLVALTQSIAGEIGGAEAMLNASMGNEVDAPVPPLLPFTVEKRLPSWTTVKAALATRPELLAGGAEIERARAEVKVMRDMYWPMALVRTGVADTMSEGRGAMLMVGISVPIWRPKLRAGVAEAKAMQRMAESDLRAMTRMIEGEAAQALGELQAAAARQAVLRRDVLPRARAALEPTIAGYAAGRQPLVGVIEAIQALWSVEGDLIEADMRAGLAWVRLGRAMGSYEEMLEP
jgi:outer membrane protein TolC